MANHYNESMFKSKDLRNSFDVGKSRRFMLEIDYIRHMN